MIQAKHIVEKTRDGRKRFLFPERKETDFPAALRDRKFPCPAGRRIVALPRGSPTGSPCRMSFLRKEVEKGKRI
jgi:hypothetical protein